MSSNLDDKVERIRTRANKLFQKWVSELEGEAREEGDGLAAESEVLQAYMTAGYSMYTKIKETLEMAGAVIEARRTENTADRVLYKVYREDTGEVLEWCATLAEAEESARRKSLEIRDTPVNYESVTQEASKLN